MHAGPSLIMIDDTFDTGRFTDHLSNDIYVSVCDKFSPYSYRSGVSIKFVQKGVETYSINRKVRQLQENQFLVVNKDELVTAEVSSPGLRTVGLSIFLDSLMLSSLYNNIINPDDLLEPAFTPAPEFYDGVVSDDEIMSDYLRKLLRGFVSGRIIPSELTTIQIAEQLLQYKMRFERKIKNIGRKKRSSQIEIYRRTSLAREYLDNSVGKSFDLNELANVSCMSKYFLIKSFNRLYGSTPQRYHASRRINKALLLLSRGLTVTEVAVNLGYSSIFYFSRQFKQFVGKSPRVFLSSLQY